jgi:hypothetical protein
MNAHAAAVMESVHGPAPVLLLMYAMTLDPLSRSVNYHRNDPLCTPAKTSVNAHLGDTRSGQGHEYGFS